MTWREAFQRSPLARRLIFWTILFSSAVTLVLTGLQLYRDYRHDIGQIERNFNQIEVVHLATLTESLWATDKERMQLQLEGMLQLRDMHYLEVREGSVVWASAGHNGSKNVIRRDIPLRYIHDGREQVLGTLTAVATLDHVYARLLGEALTILIGNGLKTFLVALFMLLLIYYQVTRHLLAISRFAHQFDPENPIAPLSLDRAPQEDELRTTVTALNSLQTRLSESRAKIAEGKERFRSTFEQAAVGIAHMSPDGHWLRVNQKLCDIVGYTREELRTKTFQDITHPDDLDVDLAQMRQMLVNDIQTFSMEKRYIRKDGGSVWINLTASLVRKKTGEPDYFIAVVEDIEARRRAEDDVRRSENLLAESQRIAHLGSFEWDALSGDLHWSEELYRIYGVTPQGCTPNFEAFMAQIHPDDRERVQSLVAGILKDGKPIKYEDRILRPTGEERQLTTEVSPVKDDSGRVVRLIGACHDITERKLAEEAWRKNEKKFRTIIDTSPVPYAMNDERQNITYLNVAFVRTYGYTLEDIPTLSDWWPKAYPDPEYRQWVAVTWQDRLNRAQEIGGIFEPLELDIHCKNGSVKTVLVEAAAMDESWGGSHLVILYDITERKQNEIEREQMLNELNRRNTEMEAFIYTISHDLKSPLITIGGFSSLMEKDIARGDNASTADSLNEIKKAVALMQTHINDLLLLSRTGRASEERTDVPMSTLLQEVCAQLKKRVTDADAQIIIVPDLPVMHVDRKGLVRVFTNLIDNALKYRRPDIAPHIEIGWEIQDDELRLYVRDNGQGIKDEYQQRIFGLFQRIDSNIEGTGVGLAITKRVIEVHGGRIWVESKPGKGSTFWIGLPQTTMVAV